VVASLPMNLRSLLLVVCALTFPAVTHADSLPACPPGTHMVANPTTPGSMHHGGMHCEPSGPAAEAPVGTPPAETPPSTPEAALATAPASAESVPAPPAPTTEPAPSGMCSVRAGADPSLLALGLVSGALLFVRRRR